MLYNLISQIKFIFLYICHHQFSINRMHPKFSYRLIKTLFLSLISFIGLSQSSYRLKNMIEKVASNQKIAYQTAPTTSLFINLPAGVSLKNASIITKNEVVELRRDIHFEDENRSILVVFDKPIEEFTLQTGEMIGEVEIQKNFVKPLDKSLIVSSLRINDCDKPALVLAADWRRGLAPPKEAPTQTKTKQIIVHHAAGSNTATDYIEVVRNIYFYHTQSNGWNDVGYNFLIAQDGTIFEGRDGQGKMDGDNVLGAHFCSKNTGTMGICLLGDYMTAQPTTKSLESLAKLIGWKMKKESLDPLAKSTHATTNESLNNISGHRDGCSTDCPGTNLYVKLEEVRQNVVKSCNFVTVLANEDFDKGFNVYPNPVTNQLIIETLEEVNLFDELGRKFVVNSTKSDNKTIINTADLQKGKYILKVNGRSRRVVVE
jgi:hypothetical protein